MNRQTVLLTSLAWCALASGCASGPAPAAGTAPVGEQRLAAIDAQAARLGDAVARDLARVRVATAPYRDLAAAQAEGFPTGEPPCLDSLPVGTMGHHYVDRRIVDDTVEVERPEILLYAPQADGSKKLVAVEYIIPYRIRPRTETPPRIFDQEMKRQDALNLWYLHVWAWAENPAGLFADWNPAVRCPVRDFKGSESLKPRFQGL
jgi:hypothetical protein